MAKEMIFDLKEISNFWWHVFLFFNSQGVSFWKTEGHCGWVSGHFRLHNGRTNKPWYYCYTETSEKNCSVRFIGVHFVICYIGGWHPSVSYSNFVWIIRIILRNSILRTDVNLIVMGWNLVHVSVPHKSNLWSKSLCWYRFAET